MKVTEMRTLNWNFFNFCTCKVCLNKIGFSRLSRQSHSRRLTQAKGKERINERKWKVKYRELNGMHTGEDEAKTSLHSSMGALWRQRGQHQAVLPSLYSGSMSHVIRGKRTKAPINPKAKETSIMTSNASHMDEEALRSMYIFPL